MIKYVIYNIGSDSLGYYAGKYQFQHEVYGIWGNLGEAKKYKSKKVAEKILNGLHTENSHPLWLRIKEVRE